MQYLYHLPTDTSLQMFTGLTALTASAGYLSTWALTSINPVASAVFVISNNLAGRYVDCSRITENPIIDIVKNLAIAIFATKVICDLTIEATVTVACATVGGPLAFVVTCAFVAATGSMLHYCYQIYTDPTRYRVFQEYGLSGILYYDIELERRMNERANGGIAGDTVPVPVPIPDVQNDHPTDPADPTNPTDPTNLPSSSSLL